MNTPLYQKMVRFAKLSAVILFFMVLFSPLLGNGLHIKNIVSLNEKRTLAQFPTITLDLQSLEQFAKAFEQYYDDNFTFRNSLIFFGNYVKTKFLSSSPNPKVIIGKEDWLYYSGDKVSNLTEAYSSSAPLTKEELIQLQSYLEAKRNWLAHKGIRYLLVIAPDKQSVYPEFLPSNYLRAGDPLEQLMDYLRSNSDVDVLDVRDALRRAKANHPVYYKTDTHWNEYGGFIACNEIIEHLRARFPEMRPLSLADYEITNREETHRDLANMLAMGALFRETVPRMIKVIPAKAHNVELGYELPGAAKIDGATFFASERTDDKKGGSPRAVVFGDSFSRYLVPYLSESFSRAMFMHIWNSPPAVQKEAIEHEKPEVVVDEIVERLLKGLLSKPIEQDVAVRDYKKLFISSTRTMSYMGPRTKYDGITPSNQVEISLQNVWNSRGLTLHSTGEDPSVHLPYFVCPADKRLVVKIDITSPEDTVLQLYYMTSASSQYSESKSIKQSLHKGRNVLYIPLAQTDLYGRLRLDPGTLPGDYVIHYIEIRAIPGMS